MRMSAKMRAFLEEVQECPGERFDEKGGVLIGLAWSNGWIRSDTDGRPDGALKDAAWWLTPKGEQAMAERTAA